MPNSISKVHFGAFAGFFQASLYKDAQTGKATNANIHVLDADQANGFVLGVDNYGIAGYRRDNGVQTYLGRALFSK